jgi:hypothetical protein
LIFVFHKIGISPKFAIFILANVHFWGEGEGMPHSCMGDFPRKEGGIQVLAGIAPNSQTIRYLFRTPGQQSKPEKNQQKLISANSFQWKKIDQLFDQMKFSIFMVQ